jgi:hypothetical protein
LHCNQGSSQNNPQSVVTIKHASGFVLADRHGNPFQYPGPHYVAHGGSAQIVNDQAHVLQFIAEPITSAGQAVLLLINCVLTLRTANARES